MRIRTVKPSYWADALLHKELDAPQREFYIGLWMECDDDGWFRVDVPEIAAELYRYEAVESRETMVSQWLRRFRDLGRITLHECGHGQVIRLTAHQWLAGPSKRVYTVRNEHLERCTGLPPEETRGDPRATAWIDREEEGKGQDRIGPTSLEQLCTVIARRWRWSSVSPAQRDLLARLADRHGSGARGYAAVEGLLQNCAAEDPIAYLKEVDARLRDDGLQRAERQEAESARWKAARPMSPRGNHPEQIGGVLKRLEPEEGVRE